MSNFHFRLINKSLIDGHCRPDPAVKITNFCENTKVFPFATFFSAPSAIPAENTLQWTITYNRSSFANFAKIFILKTGHIRCYLTGITFATDSLASDRSFESLVTGYIYKGLSNQSLINTWIKYMFQCLCVYLKLCSLNISHVYPLPKSQNLRSHYQKSQKLST